MVQISEFQPRWKSVGRRRGLSKTPSEIGPMMKKAFDTAGPVIFGAQVDYTDNQKLFEMARGDSIH
jgi:hypothetical protein